VEADIVMTAVAETAVETVAETATKQRSFISVS